MFHGLKYEIETCILIAGYLGARSMRNFSESSFEVFANLLAVWVILEFDDWIGRFFVFFHGSLSQDMFKMYAKLTGGSRFVTTACVLLSALRRNIHIMILIL